MGYRSLYMSPLIFVPNTTLMLAVDDKIRVYDTSNGKEVRKFTPDKDAPPPASIAISPDGRLLAEAGWEAREILVRYVADGRILVRIPVNERPGRTGKRQLAFAPDGKTLAIGLQNVHVWKLLPRGADNQPDEASETSLLQ